MDLLGELFRSVQAHSPVALFGINKVGQDLAPIPLQDTCQSSHSIAVYLDLKQFALDAKYVLFSHRARNWAGRSSPDDWETLAQGIEQGACPLDLAADKLLDLVSHSGDVKQPIALLFDEWDYLFPSSLDLDDGFEGWLAFCRVLSQIASRPGLFLNHRGNGYGQPGGAELEVGTKPAASGLSQQVGHIVFEIRVR